MNTESNLKRKYVFLIYSLEKAGGSERVLSVLINQFSKTDTMDITVITLFGRKTFFAFPSGIQVIDIESTTSSRLIAVRLFHTIKIINNLRPDIITGISINRLNIFLALGSFFFQGSPKLVASEHIAFENSTVFIKCLKKVLYSKFSRIVVLTDEDRRLLIKKGFRNVVTVVNPCSFDIVSTKPVLGRNKKVIALGRLSYQKGFDILLKIWSKVHAKYPDWKMEIYGEGGEYQNLMFLISELGISSESLRIQPFSPNVKQLLEESQIYAMTSRFEGLPMVLIEALTAGCCIVSFDCKTGPREILDEKSTGVLVEDGNVEEFIRALEGLMSDPDRRELISNSALLASTKYNRRKVAGSWLSLYDEL
ncbi:MAG: glycosyltransferase family 4 protein [Arcticibacter sp.]